MALYAGYLIVFDLYAESVASGRNPFRIDRIIVPFPRVARKKRGQPWAVME
jgi:hypothetical protein